MVLLEVLMVQGDLMVLLVALRVLLVAPRVLRVAQMAQATIHWDQLEEVLSVHYETQMDLLVVPKVQLADRSVHLEARMAQVGRNHFDLLDKHQKGYRTVLPLRQDQFEVHHYL